MLLSGVALLAKVKLEGGAAWGSSDNIICPSVCPFQIMSTKVLRWIFVKKKKNEINGDFNSSCLEVFGYSQQGQKSDLSQGACLNAVASAWPAGSPPTSARER